MEIVFKNTCINDKITLTGNVINGLMGNYDEFVNSISNKNCRIVHKFYDFYTDYVYDEILIHFNKNNLDNYLSKYFKLFKLKDDFKARRISTLSSSEKRILYYILSFLSDAKIYVIDEPFLDLDYEEKKLMINIFHQMIKDGKTLIIASNDSDIIYTLCKKVLLIGKDKFIYDKVNKLLIDEDILKEYNIIEPSLVHFVNLAHKKNIVLPYTQDIRDLMKDVYKNV